MNYKIYEKKISVSYKSDGCTLAPDGKWKSCCIIHDHARNNKDVMPSQADKMLYDCMRDRANFPLAVIYYIWVRIQSISGMSPIGLAMLVSIVTVMGLLIVLSTN